MKAYLSTAFSMKCVCARACVRACVRPNCAAGGLARASWAGGGVAEVELRDTIHTTVLTLLNIFYEIHWSLHGDPAPHPPPSLPVSPSVCVCVCVCV